MIRNGTKTVVTRFSRCSISVLKQRFGALGVRVLHANAFETFVKRLTGRRASDVFSFLFLPESHSHSFRGQCDARPRSSSHRRPAERKLLDRDLGNAVQRVVG
jgi:hypothetical protein